MTEAEIEITRKRLLWRATHRGIREMDILVGGFAITRLSTMTAADLRQFEVLLELPDQDLLSWATAIEPVPQKLRCQLLDDILQYRPEAP